MTIISIEQDVLQKKIEEGIRQAMTRVLTDLAAIAEKAAASPQLAFVSGPVALAGFAKTIRDMIPGFEEPEEKTG
jgi:hypothetical protein